MGEILIVEDDQDAGVLMQLVLRRAGHDARLARTGPAALGACDHHTPDLILLDVTLPEIDGYTVARMLKGRPDTADVPLIFVTGATDTRHKVEGLTLGANDYITKPFHRDELVARVDVALRIKRQADELKAANAQLAALSLTDGLTGLCNRRHLDHRVEEEVARANRYHSPLSYLMLDIDSFKRVNDRYGHQEGDQVLQMVARILRQSTRISDIVGRYGGEEFAVVAPATDMDAALILAERIRSRVDEEKMVLRGTPTNITVSIGAAQLRPGGTVEELVAAADAALYAAKDAGRNRVMAARDI